VSQRNRIVIAVVVVAALVGGYWKLALAPQRERAAALERAIAAKQAEARDAKAKLATYREARDSYRANYATLLRLGKAVPQDDDTRSLLVQLDAAAQRSGVDFRTLTVDGGAASASTPAASSAPSSAAGTAASPVASATPPPGAVSVGSAGFSTMPFTFSFRGDFANLSGFFDRLQRFVTTHNERMSVTGRLLRLDAITLKPDASGFPRLRADVTASSFLLPATQGLTLGGTPSGPAAQGAPSAAAPGAGSQATTTATVMGATR
jgi:hypothetical protein